MFLHPPSLLDAPSPAALPARAPPKATTLIESLGVYLPPKAVTTREVLHGCRTALRLPFETLTGIQSRRMAGDTEFSIHLAKPALADRLAPPPPGPPRIDLLLFRARSRPPG